MTLRLNTNDTNFTSDFNKLINDDRSTSKDVTDVVATILDSIKINGDQALLELTNKYDSNNFNLDDLQLSKIEIEKFETEASDSIKKSIELAAKRVNDYHKRQMPNDQLFTDETGTTLGYQWKPIERVGIYVPGGTASYPSTVLMNAIPALVAGVRDIVMVTPASNGKLNPSTIYAAKLLQINEIYLDRNLL